MMRCRSDWRSYRFPNRGIHVPPIPPDYPVKNLLVAPDSHAMIHYGYADPRDREEKTARYLSLESTLTPQELEHAKSIMGDECMLVVPPEIKFPLERAE